MQLQVCRVKHIYLSQMDENPYSEQAAAVSSPLIYK